MKSDKRKIIIVSGKEKFEVEVGGDQKKITIFKLGNPTTNDPVTEDTFRRFVELIRQATIDPNFIIVWDKNVSVEQVII